MCTDQIVSRKVWELCHGRLAPHCQFDPDAGSFPCENKATVRCIRKLGLTANEFSTLTKTNVRDAAFATVVQIPQQWLAGCCSNTYEFRVRSQPEFPFHWKETLEGSNDWKPLPHFYTVYNSSAPVETMLEASWAAGHSCPSKTFDVTILQLQYDYTTLQTKQEY